MHHFKCCLFLCTIQYNKYAIMTLLPDSSTYAHFLFEAFDTNKNGSVSFEVSIIYSTAHINLELENNINRNIILCHKSLLRPGLDPLTYCLLCHLVIPQDSDTAVNLSLGICTDRLKSVKVKVLLKVLYFCSEVKEQGLLSFFV